MALRAVALTLALVAALYATGCASGRRAAAWRPGDPIICPHCGREFTLPEKLEP